MIYYWAIVPGYVVCAMVTFLVWPRREGREDLDNIDASFAAAFWFVIVPIFYVFKQMKAVREVLLSWRWLKK